MLTSLAKAMHDPHNPISFHSLPIRADLQYISVALERPFKTLHFSRPLSPSSAIFSKVLCIPADKM
jgi:hypothetical protein